MSYFAYDRVSTKEQKLDRGVDEIHVFCESRSIQLERDIFVDKQTGRNFDRPRYVVMKEDVLRKGDILIITEVDRLGRNKREIVKELNYFKEKGVRVMILELPTTLMDIPETSDKLYALILETIQNMIIELYACLAQAEMEKKDKRQIEGIQAMKKRGDWDKYGRPKACDWNKFVQVYERVLKNELRPVDAAKELNMSIATFYRYRDKYIANLQVS